MHDSNLIQLLSNLDKASFARLGKFVASPYFNSNRKLTALYRYLSKFHPEFDSLEISHENIYRKLYKEDKVVYGTVYYLLSEFESLLEKYIGLEKLSPAELEMEYLGELTRFGMHKRFDARIKKLEKKLKEMHDEFNLNSYKLSEIKRNNSFQRNEFLTKKDLSKKEWTDASHELINMFTINNLRNILLLSNYNNLISANLEIPMMKETIEMAQTAEGMKNNAEAGALLLGIRLIKDKREEDYLKLKKIITGREGKLRRSLSDDILMVMNNYLIEGNLPGGKIMQDELFELSCLVADSLDRKGSTKIPVDMFFHIAMCAITSRNYKWAEKFLKSNSNRLEEKHRSCVIGYLQGSLYVEYRQYENAHRELSKIRNFSLVFLKPLVRNLQLIIYAELNLHSEAIDMGKSYEQFLRNDRFQSVAAKTRNRDFLKIYLKYLKASSDGSRQKLTDLLGEIRNYKRFIPYHKWFERKIAEQLEGRAGMSKAARG